MKLTYHVPDIILDNTKTETLVELITKASSSLQDSGSFLASRGDGSFEIKSISSITSSVLHDINANSPLSVDRSNKIAPLISLNGTVPVLNGGTGKNQLPSDNNILLYKNNMYNYAKIVGDDESYMVVETSTNEVKIKSSAFTAVRPSKTFFAANTYYDSIATFRYINNDDLPNIISGKSMINSNFSGIFSGSFSGSHTGNFVGDGSKLSGVKIDFATTIMGVPNGGTGRQGLSENALLVGNGLNTIKELKGTIDDDEKSLIWDTQRSEFILSKRATLLNNSFNGDQSVTGSLYSTGIISGTLYGDGANITNISFGAINNISSEIGKVLIAGANINISQGGAISVKDNIELTSITSSFYGSGANLYGLSGSQFNTFKADILSQLSGSGSVSIDQDGVIYVPITLGGNGGSSDLNTSLFTFAAEQLSVGDIVSIGSSGLAKCSKANNLLSNVIGVVYSSGSDGVRVQSQGQISVAIVGNYSTGSMVYAGNNGTAVTYDQLSQGDYITQVGFVSDIENNKIFIQPRIFGQL